VITPKIKLALKQDDNHSTIIEVKDNKIGGDKVTIIAGPCSVESYEQIIEIAECVKTAGADILRGGAFKPRTLPYSFQGLGEKGLELLSEARDLTGLPVITEVMEPESVELVEQYADILQIGSRNMQNFSLLKKVGKASKPVMLKRGMSATIEEWLGCAEYILNEGNREVILCERGVRGFQRLTRNTLDLSAIPIVKQLSHLPIIVDPSHGTGIKSLVKPMAKAGIAAGSDGLMVEVHCHPEDALCDGAQSLKPDEFKQLMDEIDLIASSVKRRL
jgi:3-deoxy-7-phosphoheptulonate synthase